MGLDRWVSSLQSWISLSLPVVCSSCRPSNTRQDLLQKSFRAWRTYLLCFEALHCNVTWDSVFLQCRAKKFDGAHARDLQYRRSTFHKVRLPHSGVSLGSWIKDRKKRKKEATRCQNAEVHAAIAIAGLAAGIAAVTAATAASASDEASTRTSIAVASAAALVAAQCVEVAERMGADRDHMAAVVSSAVNVRSAGDIMTLRASADTCEYLDLFTKSHRR